MIRCFLCGKQINSTRISLPCVYHYTHIECIEKYHGIKRSIYKFHSTHLCRDIEVSFLSTLNDDTPIISTIFADESPQLEKELYSKFLVDFKKKY